MKFVKEIYNQLKNRANSLLGQPHFLAGIFLLVFVIFSTVLLSDRLFSQAVLSNCTATSNLNTTFPPNSCIPVACSSLSAAIAKNPDNAAGYNCYYSPLGAPLRPCKAFSNAAAFSSPQPRVNCADLIDMPLCSIFVPANAAPGVNCVKEAEDVTDPNSAAVPRKIRGVDYALNNKDSIRFCGQVEPCGASEVCNATQMSSSTNCTPRPKCHQMTKDETPNAGTNCDILGCNLLAVEELKVSDSRFDNSLKKYCDGSVKCYSFFNNTPTNPANSSNLQYLRYRSDNTMCQIHNCPPDSKLCGVDDTQNLLNKDSNYQADYIKYINANMPIESGLCKPLSCKPIAFRSYRCTPMADTNPTTLNSSCDACVACAATESCPSDCGSGQKKQVCSGGYCNKIIDCNSAANSSQPECVVSTADSIDITSDLFNAWFYRPTPPSRVTDDDGLVSLDIASKINNDKDPSTAGTQPNLCYSVGDVKDLGWGTSYDTVLFGSYFWHTLGMDTRSPNLCSASHDGFRGNGYGYLSGTALNIFKNPDKDVGFISGLASANYELTDPQYKIKACLRYANSGQLGVHGSRECRFNIAGGPYSLIQTQWCGSDVCKEMTISESDVDRCSMAKHSDIFDTDNSPSCVSGTIDGYVRMRARKYGRRLCVFIDHKGAVAYDPKNFDGKEKLSDGTCLDGDPDVNGDCKGKNTNDVRGLASVWRTVKMIQYIGNNRSGNQKAGYIDMDGRFFAAQDCAKIPLRVGPPRFYGVATISNSSNLFEPPLYILSVRAIRGGQISDPVFGNQFGFTDFYKPEIVVGYGAVQQKMSLGDGYLGIDGEIAEYYPSSPSSVIIKNASGNTPYSANVFVKKEYNEELSQPTFCLYRRVNDVNGIPTTPVRINCVNRTKPEISDIFNNQIRMRTSIIPDPSNKFDNAKLTMSLIADSGAKSKAFNFENPTTDVVSCTKDIEAYKFCSNRDTCSQLLYECADNEIALQKAIIATAPTAQFDAMKTRCNTTLLSDCNRKLGIFNSAAPDFFSQIDTTPSTLNLVDRNYQNFQSLLNSAAKSAIDPKYKNAYGWFNEICIVKGFEDKLKKVIAYKTIDGVLGKCLIDESKSQYNMNRCSAGGKAPYCVCIDAVDDLAGSEQEVRLQTPREAGLCIDIPIPKFCQAIDYTNLNSSDPNDPNFTTSSINNSVAYKIFGLNYNDEKGVHTSHQLRTNFDSANHAEYNSIIGGAGTVYGSCGGFWKAQTNSAGSTLPPILNCKIDGTWERPATSNMCVRYSCPAITTAGIQDGNPDNNSYQNDYALGETGDARGASNGYATWSGFQKTNDFLENVSTKSCITGYELPAGASGITRACKQDGKWGLVNNSCVRKRCPIVAVGAALPNIVLPVGRSAATEIATWNLWGGAEFKQGGLASRSETFVPPESKVIGSCRADVGFYPGVAPPTMECGSDGKWFNLQNPCMRLECAQITAATSENPSEGFALWNSTELSNGVPVTVTAAVCALGYFQNPYTQMPSRQCVPQFVNNEWLSKWSAVNNPCIKMCPGADMDPTIGIGITTELTANGPVNINWQSTAPSFSGNLDYKNYAYNERCSGMNASNFTQNRNNGCYQLRRICGNGSNGYAKGQWGPVEAMCVANNGQNGNAKFDINNPYGVPTFSNTTSGSADAIAASYPAIEGGPQLVGACVANFGVQSGVAPTRKCVYVDVNNNGTIDASEKIIDKVYLKLVGGTQDCKPTCSITNYQSFGSGSQYNGTTTIFPGSSLTLSCKSGYLSALNYYGARSGTSPTITCQTQPNGTATWANLTNDCSLPRNCYSYSPISGPTSCYASASGWDWAVHYSSSEMFSINGTGGWKYVGIDLSNRNHGSSADGCRRWDDRGRAAIHGRFILQCDDGTYYSKEDCGSGGCP